MKTSFHCFQGPLVQIVPASKENELSANVSNSWQNVIELTWNQMLRFIHRSAKLRGGKKKANMVKKVKRKRN